MVAGAADLGLQLPELGGQPVADGGLALDVGDERGADLIASGRLGGRLVVGDRQQQPGDQQRDAHQRGGPTAPASRRGGVPGVPGGSPRALVGGLLVGGVEGLGEHLVEQRRTERPHATAPSGSGHDAVPDGGSARSARTRPTAWTT